MAKAVLIGYGEIGKAVYEVFSEFHEIDIHDPFCPEEKIATKCEIDILIIAIPFNLKFVDAVIAYQKIFKARAT